MLAAYPGLRTPHDYGDSLGFSRTCQGPPQHQLHLPRQQLRTHKGWLEEKVKLALKSIGLDERGAVGPGDAFFG